MVVVVGLLSSPRVGTFTSRHSLHSSTKAEKAVRKSSAVQVGFQGEVVRQLEFNCQSLRHFAKCGHRKPSRRICFCNTSELGHYPDGIGNGFHLSRSHSVPWKSLAAEILAETDQTSSCFDA